MLTAYGIGGGTELYLQQWLAKEANLPAIVLRRVLRTSLAEIVFKDRKRSSGRLAMSPCAAVAKIAGCCGRVLVNHLQGWDIPEVKALLSAVRHTSKAEIVFAVHDYLFVDSEIISLCDTVLVFSEDSLRRIGEAVPAAIPKLRLQPHEPIEVFAPIEVKGGAEPVIGIVGNLTADRGDSIVEKLADYMASEKLPGRIVVLGITEHPFRRDRVLVHGHYEHSELPQLVRQYGINVGFVPSIIPETFSYVTQELMMLGLPVACFNLGAPAERISSYQHGAIIPEITPEAVYMTITRLRRDFVC